MTRLRLAYIHRYKDRHGKVRHYYRNGERRVALPGLPGSAEFMAGYQAALSGQPVAAPAPRSTAGTFDALAAAYYRSTEYVQLAAVTKATYRNIIEKFRAEHGTGPIAGMRREHVRRLIAKRASTPAAANGLLKMLRILFAFAVAEGICRDDPTAGVKRVRVTSEGFATWSEADLAAFEARWPIGTRQRLAFALLLCTGQRRSDVVRMGPQHVRDGSIDVRQQKTGKRLTLPVLAPLAEALAGTSTGHLAFLVTEAGQPFTSAGFGNWFADAVRGAGLSGLAAHGLRKAAATRLAQAGCTAHQIAAVTGHSNLREVELYTRAADQVAGARAAFGKLTG